MKSLVVLVLLNCFLHHTLSAVPAALSMLEEGCCPGYNQTRIPKPCVKRVAMTASHCKPKAIVFTTESKKLCIDPNLKWAKDMLDTFEDGVVTYNSEKCKKFQRKV
ncbi:C-C motif chemokine 13-like [Perca flavescens]|uniref:C-C motif chemokine 13-like n=1 Tax=Perca flavescens TaxID=8167 RepID=UPI00106EA466|nr:C-C motif chemokine 13-like [Perca flavescens]